MCSGVRSLRAAAGQWRRDIEWTELYGNRTAEFWSQVAATRRALEEVLTAVVDVREMERRNLDLCHFPTQFRQGHVLLLGDFRKGRDRLLALAHELELLGYLPILADDIPDIREHDLRQKILQRR